MTKPPEPKDKKPAETKKDKRKVRPERFYTPSKEIKVTKDGIEI